MKTSYCPLLLSFTFCLAFTSALSQATSPDWAQTYSDGKFASRDQFHSMLIDEDGNAWLTGFTENTETGFNMMAVKVNGQGVVQWQTEVFLDFDGVQPVAMQQDTSGNTYLCANQVEFSFGQAPKTLLAKLDTAGNVIWEKSYDTGQVSPNDMNVDENGDIYLVGTYREPSGSQKAAAARFDDEGNELWKAVRNDTAEINGPRARGQKILVPPSENFIYVVYSYLKFGCCLDKFLVQKVQKADGMVLWERFFETSIQNASVDVIDAEMDTGHSLYVLFRHEDRSVNEFTRMGLAKFDTSGNAPWVFEYDGLGVFEPEDMVTFRNTDVFIGGYSKDDEGSFEFSTLRVDSSGQMVWDNFWEYSTEDDVAKTIAVDENGSCYVAGFNKSGQSYLNSALKYTYDGNLDWDITKDAPLQSMDEWQQIQVGPSGNVLIAGRRSIFDRPEIPHYDFKRDYLLNRLDQQGNHIWEKTFTGAGASKIEPRYCITDEAGNIYVAAASNLGLYDPNNVLLFHIFYEILLLKYNAAGELLWHRSYQDSLYSWSFPKALKIDQEGNILLFLPSSRPPAQGPGWSVGAVSVLKYDTSGQRLWTYHHDLRETGPGFDHDYHLDAQGNILLGVRTNNTVAAAKIDADGQLIWETEIPNPDGEYIARCKLTQGAPDRYFLIGTGWPNQKTLVGSIDTSGNFLWQLKKEGRAYDIDADDQGNSYLVFFRENGFQYDLIVEKYDAQGTLQWTKTLSTQELSSLKLKLLNDNDLLIISDSNLYRLTASGRINYQRSFSHSFWQSHISDEYIYLVNRDLYRIGRYSHGGSLIERYQYDQPGNITGASNDLGIHIDGEYIYAVGNETGVVIRNYYLWSAAKLLKYQSMQPNGNRPPRIISIPVTTAQNGGGYEYQVLGEDWNGDSLSYSLLQAPPWMAIDARTGLISGTPDGMSGTHTVSIQVTDHPAEATGEQTFTLDVVTDTEIRPKPSLQVQVFPNPVVEELHLQIEYEQISEWTLRIYDYSGREIIGKAALSGGDNVLSLKSLPPGVYVLEISEGQQVFFRDEIIKL